MREEKGRGQKEEEGVRARRVREGRAGTRDRCGVHRATPQSWASVAVFGGGTNRRRAPGRGRGETGDRRRLSFLTLLALSARERLSSQLPHLVSPSSDILSMALACPPPSSFPSLSLRKRLSSSSFSLLRFVTPPPMYNPKHPLPMIRTNTLDLRNLNYQNRPSGIRSWFV